MKAQAAIKNEIIALPRAGVYRPLKRASKVDVATKDVTMGPVKKARPTSNKDGSVLTSIPTRWFTLMWWKYYLDSCVVYHSFFVEEFLCDTRG